MRVLHVVTGMNGGGAERMLARLLASMDPSRFESTVVSLLGEGIVAPAIRDLGIDVVVPADGRPVQAALRVRRMLPRLRPDLVQGWMYHGNLAASFATAGRAVPTLWNVRQSLHFPGSTGRTTRGLIHAGRLVSGRTAAIVYNSRVTARQHEAIGYDARRSVVLANGVDTQVWAPRPDARRSVRSELGLAAEARLVGRIGRYHAVKDHETFLRAVARAVARDPDLHVVMAGHLMTPDHPSLAPLVSELGLQGRVHLLGIRDDAPRLLAALDVLVSSSRGEGFPNVVAEAMASGVPCVVTDVGESVLLVGETGRVVPPGDPVALGRALADVLAMPQEGRRALGDRARARIEADFTLAAATARYEALYEAVARRPVTARPA